MMTIRKMRWALPALLLCSSVLHAESVEKRVERMERLLEGKSLLQMMERLDALQMEVQQLRGQLEEQQHQMEGMKGRQRELYLDVDRRMLRLEREGGGGAAAAGSPAGQPLTTAPAAEAPVAVSRQPSATAAGEQRLEQEREAYQKAFELLRELRYEQATAEFRNFLHNYPNGRYAHIAQYWLGEAAYARRDFKQAIRDYQALLDNHPRSAKRAEAMLKIGYSYQELNKDEQAEQTLKRLIELYPDSTEAGQARNQLKRLKKRGG